MATTPLISATALTEVYAHDVKAQNGKQRINIHSVRTLDRWNKRPAVSPTKRDVTNGV